jgi:hypothetical protein
MIIYSIYSINLIKELNKAWCAEVTRAPVAERTQEDGTSPIKKSVVSRPQSVFRPALHRGKENKPIRGKFIIIVKGSYYFVWQPL